MLFLFFFLTFTNINICDILHGFPIYEHVVFTDNKWNKHTLPRWPDWIWLNYAYVMCLTDQYWQIISPYTQPMSDISHHHYHILHLLLLSREQQHFMCFTSQPRRAQEGIEIQQSSKKNALNLSQRGNEMWQALCQISIKSPASQGALRITQLH